MKSRKSTCTGGVPHSMGKLENQKYMSYITSKITAKTACSGNITYGCDWIQPAQNGFELRSFVFKVTKLLSYFNDLGDVDQLHNCQLFGEICSGSCLLFRNVFEHAGHMYIFVHS